MSAPTKSKQVEEIIKSGKNPNYFFNNYVKIQHPVKGLIKFDTFDFQNDCVDTFLEERFSIVLKSRQLGMSTLVAAHSLWMALFQRDKNILVIATKLTVAQNFITKVKTMFRSLPSWIVLPETTASNKQLIEFSNGSSIKAIPTSDDAGRSEALSLLIVDEAAFVKNFDDLWMGLYPTISTGGRVIILSTPNGVGGQYYNLYTNAEAGLNEFKSIKLPWDVHPERDEAWFEETTKNLSDRQIAQEYLCDFAASGETFLSSNDIEYIRNSVAKPKERCGPDRGVWIWKYPLSENNYIISADVSRGDSRDYSTFHVIDINESECVAEYKGKIPPDRLGELLVEYGEKYNNALICPENNSYGYATILKIKELNYPNLYYKKRKAVYIGGYTPDYNPDLAGFTTSGRTRSLILTKLEEVLRNKMIKIYSTRFYEELKTFVWVGNKAQGMKGHNDDLVMSFAIGVWLFDASDTYSKSNKDVNNAMLKAMSVTRNSYDDLPEAILEGRPYNNPGSDNKNLDSKQKLNRDIHTSDIKNKIKILNDWKWVL
tara:strand:- start:4739 stop:6367 length:1629 start_codon:yes stop_codon:yes gene_type:complete